MKLLPKLFREENGQTLVFAALSLVCVLGFSGMAVDVGLMMHAKRDMQIAADSAAVAGAAEIPNADYSAVAKAVAAMNGETDGTKGATVTINNGPSAGPYKNNTNYLEALVSQSVPTMFMGVLGPKTMTVSARAVATRGGPSSNCVYTLGTSGTGILANGNVNISAPSCGIVDDAGMTVNGNINLTAKAIGVVGGYTPNGNVTISPAPVTGITGATDPLAYVPAPAFNAGSCIADPSYNGNSTATIGPVSPGGTVCYNGLTVNGNSNVTLSPGIYVINGNLSFNGNSTITGAGVTFYLTGGSSFNGNVNMNLSAPTSGAYNGMLFYQSRTDASAVTINGNSSSVFKGILYFPDATVTFNGNSGSQYYTDLVVKSLVLNGNASFQDYAALNSNNLLSAVKLVE